MGSIVTDTEFLFAYEQRQAARAMLAALKAQTAWLQNKGPMRGTDAHEALTDGLAAIAQAKAAGIK